MLIFIAIHGLRTYGRNIFDTYLITSNLCKDFFFLMPPTIYHYPNTNLDTLDLL